jgi:hypothetical protein
MSENTAKGFGTGKAKGAIAGPGMTEDAELVFHEWFESLVNQDIRYNTKAIGLLARQAMVDDAFRAQVLQDPAGALRALGANHSLPTEFAVKFVDNTSTLLNVVLPPRAATIAKYFGSTSEPASEQRVAVRLRLRSRTADFPTLFHDDWNLGDPGNDLSLGMIVPPA